MTRPQTDDYADELRDVVAALLSEGRAAAGEKLAPIVYPTREVVARSEPAESLIAAAYKRDRFHCRYCGCRVIPTQVMRLISEIFPDEFPYHPNWKAGQTHPAIPSRSATLDHVEPWALGGTNNLENLVCACWACNRVKGGSHAPVARLGAEADPDQGRLGRADEQLPAAVGARWVADAGRPPTLAPALRSVGQRKTLDPSEACQSGRTGGRGAGLWLTGEQ